MRARAHFSPRVPAHGELQQSARVRLVSLPLLSSQLSALVVFCVFCYLWLLAWALLGGELRRRRVLSDSGARGYAGVSSTELVRGASES